MEPKRLVLAGEIEEDEPVGSQADSHAIDGAIQRFLVEVKATKGSANLNAYKRDLHRFRKHCTKPNMLFFDPRIAGEKHCTRKLWISALPQVRLSGPSAARHLLPTFLRLLLH